MPWRFAPKANWSDRDREEFLREIFTRARFDAFTFDPGSIGANSTLSTSVVAATTPQVTGLRVGQPVFVTPPSTFDDGLVASAYVVVDDTLTIRIVNTTGSPINPASGTWSFFGMMR